MGHHHYPTDGHITLINLQTHLAAGELHQIMVTIKTASTSLVCGWKPKCFEHMKLISPGTLLISTHVNKQATLQPQVVNIYAQIIPSASLTLIFPFTDVCCNANTVEIHLRPLAVSTFHSDHKCNTSVNVNVNVTDSLPPFRPPGKKLTW